MSPARSLRHKFKHARSGLRSAALRRTLRSVAAGSAHTVAFNLDDKTVDIVGVVTQVMGGLPPESPPALRLMAAFRRSGLVNQVLDGLGSRDSAVRARSAQLVGALHIEQSAAWLAPLLSSRDMRVADSAARALGRIGGARAAEALLLAIQRGPRRVFIIELARAAPDLFLESELCRLDRTGAHAAVALAAGLRRHHTAVRPLMRLLVEGTRQQRAVSCRALGWIGSWTAIPLIQDALGDREWKVRLAAAKALRALDALLSRQQVDALVADRYSGVRNQGLTMMRRMGPRP